MLSITNQGVCLCDIEIDKINVLNGKTTCKTSCKYYNLLKVKIPKYATKGNKRYQGKYLQDYDFALGLRGC